MSSTKVEETILEHADPRGIMSSVFALPELSEAECRMIFLDWLLGVPIEQNQTELVNIVYQHYGPKFPDHPMTEILSEGSKGSSHTRRKKRTAKGRRAARLRRDI